MENRRERIHNGVEYTCRYYWYCSYDYKYCRDDNQYQESQQEKMTSKKQPLHPKFGC